MAKLINPAGLSPGQEQHALWLPPGRRTKKCCQYDYRHTDGELFSCVAPTLDAARAKRDEWLSRKRG